MGKSRFISVLDIRLGAISSFGAVRGWTTEQIASVLVSHAGMKPADAEQLATHWHASGPYRIGRGEQVGPSWETPSVSCGLGHSARKAA